MCVFVCSWIVVALKLLHGVGRNCTAEMEELCEVHLGKAYLSN